MKHVGEDGSSVCVGLPLLYWLGVGGCGGGFGCGGVWGLGLGKRGGRRAGWDLWSLKSAVQACVLLEGPSQMLQ